MKRVVAVILILSCTLAVSRLQNKANAINDLTYWDGQTTLQEVGQIDEAATNLPPECTPRNTEITLLEPMPPGTPDYIRLRTAYPKYVGEYCHIINSQGTFAANVTSRRGVPVMTAGYYHPVGSLAPWFIPIHTIGNGAHLSPAPQGNAVLELRLPGVLTSGYESITVHKNFQTWGKVAVEGTNVRWRINTETFAMRSATKLTYSDGAAMSLGNYAFSRNGRYLLVENSEGLQLIDLIDFKRTLVYGRENGVKSLNFAISNDGNTVALTNVRNELKLIDVSGCEHVEEFGSWERVYAHLAPKYTYPGCRTIKDVKTDLTDAELLTFNAQIKRLYFSQTGDRLFFSLKSDAWTFENQVHEYSWHEYEVIANDYVPSAAGYLAMGDSYSSGEGDTEGGTWYEPGTDEPGDKSTFAGRNLCHLSRRSYPYLIAQDLGYLNSNNSSPPANGLFHSVACSGAKIHNITGIIGEKHDDGEEYEFKYTDNQYRFEETLFGSWMPGTTKQLSALTSWITPTNDTRDKFDPEIITLGIGGNDAGFGNFLMACLASGTCEQAQDNTDKSVKLGVRIAQLKSQLTKTYKKVKQEAPEARIYVHGYPVFVRPTAGNCANNVRLDDQERQFAANTTKYMNSIVKAAAKEAGVYYADVTNIFEGGRLCDENSYKYVNGATAGNDKDLFEGAKIKDYPLPQGICIRTCIGNESYHPNSEGFKKYKTALLQLTDNFEAPMPSPESNVPIPLPSATLFGVDALTKINDMNEANGATDESQFTSDGIIIPDTNTSNEYTVRYNDLYPGSEVEIEVHSTPISLGSFLVDNSGKFNAKLSLPWLEPGYHELHIFGLNSFGNEIDIFQSFFVGHSSEDFDGDGIGNTHDSCPTLADVGVDQDGDGVDDGCDGSINNTEQTNEQATNAHALTDRLINSSANQLSATVNRATQTTTEGASGGPDEKVGETIDEGALLGVNTESTDAQLPSKVGVQWWVIALSISFVGSLTTVIKKVAYAKTK